MIRGSRTQAPQPRIPLGRRRPQSGTLPARQQRIPLGRQQPQSGILPAPQPRIPLGRRRPQSGTLPAPRLPPRPPLRLPPRLPPRLRPFSPRPLPAPCATTANPVGRLEVALIVPLIRCGRRKIAIRKPTG